MTRRNARARRRILPAWMHRLYAKAMGFYWLPCPLCGEMGGGHEKTGGDLIRNRTGNGLVGDLVCPACGPEAHRLNVERGLYIPGSEDP